MSEPTKVSDIKKMFERKQGENSDELDIIVLDKIENSKHAIEDLRDITKFLTTDERNLLLNKVSDNLFFILYINGRV